MKSKKNEFISFILIFSMFLVTVIIIGYLTLCKNSNSKNAIIKEKSNNIAVFNYTKKQPKNYINETNYTGNLNQFPELYEIPFKKTNNYISNKEYTKINDSALNKYNKIATEFFKNLFNVDYRNITDDRYSYLSKIMNNCEYTAFNKADDEYIYLCDRIDNILDYYIDNQIQMEAKFYTDKSLIYKDFYVFVRGELVFTIYENKDKTCEYEIGKEYKIPIEAAMECSPSNQNNIVIVNFDKAIENNYF